MKTRMLGMRANLAWYVPLVVAVLFYFVIPDITSGFNNIRLVFHRWSWGIFISPAAYIFFTSVLASVLLPIQLLLAIPIFFDSAGPMYPRRHKLSLAVAVGLAVACFLLQLLIWGSFPLPVDSEGYIRLRLIPFLPWPEHPFFG